MTGLLLLVDLEDLRRDVGGVLLVGGEALGIDQRLGALARGLGDLLPDLVGGLGAHDRAEVDLAVERIAEAVLVGEVDEAVEEFLVDVLVHVDALDAAAGLAGIEHGAVDQVLDGVRQVGVGAHIGRVAAAELEAEADEALGGGLHDGVAGRHASR